MSQTIVNTEKLFASDTLSGFSFASELYGNVISGNAEVFLLEYSANGFYRKRKNDFYLLSGGEYISESKAIVSNAVFGQFRYVRNISRNGGIFGFYQLQKNEILLLRRRQLAGLGYKHKLITVKKDTAEVFGFVLSAGVMQEEELLNAGDVGPEDIIYKNLTRVSLSSVISIQLAENISLLNTTYYQQSFDINDFRLLNETNLIFELREWLSFSFDVEYRFDSDPPSTLRPSDLNLNFGFQVNL